MKTRALRSYLCFTLLATAFLLGLTGCDTVKNWRRFI